jgi:hypothetical protein
MRPKAVVAKYCFISIFQDFFIASFCSRLWVGQGPFLSNEKAIHFLEIFSRLLLAEHTQALNYDAGSGGNTRLVDAVDMKAQ